jgi:hypothetical protein
MDAILQRLIRENFADLKGTSVEASLRVPEALMNEVIEAALEGSKKIRSCRVSVHAGNRTVVNLTTALLPWTLKFELRLDPSVDLASFGSPKVRAWLENNRLLGNAASFLNMLPEGVKLYGSQLVVDIGSFIRNSPHKQVLALVKSVGIRTEEGNAILDIKMEVSQ